MGVVPGVGTDGLMRKRAALQGGRGSTAVSTCGSGQLRDVRLINLVHDTLFWFEIDSAYPGPSFTAAMRPQWATVLDCMAKTQAAQQLLDSHAASPLPIATTWVKKPDTSTGRQQQQQQESSASAADKAGQEDVGIALRAKAWAARPLPGIQQKSPQMQQLVDQQAAMMQAHVGQADSGTCQPDDTAAEGIAPPAKRMRLQ